MLGVGDYLWRLLPANPILLRVVESGGKRKRDMFIRCGYLGLLIVLVIFLLVTSANSIAGMSLADLARQSGQIFRGMSYLQLGLVALLAPIFTAGAITQEKDSQTYDILLTTPLTNGQIVLGSLMSRLFFVIALLVSGIPIFSVTQIFGGVAVHNIAMSFAVAAATAFVTGALAMAIATFKVGTRRTIFSFYMFVVIYLVGLWLLDQMDFFKVALVDAQTGAVSSQLSQTGWLTGLHPFLALRAIFHDKAYIPPNLADLPENLRGWPWGWYLSSPTSFYVSFMFFLSIVLVTPSIILLRRMAQSTVSIRSLVLQKLHITSGDRTRKPRHVWFNPIAWREAKTKASAARASLLRYGFIATGLIGAFVLVVMFSHKQEIKQSISPGSYNPSDNILTVNGKDGGTFLLLANNGTAVKLNSKDVAPNDVPRILSGTYEVTLVSVQQIRRQRALTEIDLQDVPRQVTETDARSYLLGMVILEFAVILLIVTNAAASTVTREKEDGTLDLLLTTPITSRYYVWGKLRGLVSFVIPLLAVPIASVLMFVFYDFARVIGGNEPTFKWIVLPEAVIIMPGILVIVVAFAAILGMQMSLRCRTTVRAVMASVGIMLGVCGALGWCGFAFLQRGPSEGGVGLIFGSFSPFTVLTVLIDPYPHSTGAMGFGGRMFDPATSSDADAYTARFMVAITSWIATGVYAAIVWAMYKSMVKNFDMTIRKQSR
jgi:ABC-type transport system involved in multi-copper enzyme maturation permease subunit